MVRVRTFSQRKLLDASESNFQYIRWEVMANFGCWKVEVEFYRLAVSVILHVEPVLIGFLT
jgi:myosin-crossreactive antigen